MNDKLFSPHTQQSCDPTQCDTLQLLMKQGVTTIMTSRHRAAADFHRDMLTVAGTRIVLQPMVPRAPPSCFLLSLFLLPLSFSFSLLLPYAICPLLSALSLSGFFLFSLFSPPFFLSLCSHLSFVLSDVMRRLTRLLGLSRTAWRTACSAKASSWTM